MYQAFVHQDHYVEGVEWCGRVRDWPLPILRNFVAPLCRSPSDNISASALPFASKLNQGQRIRGHRHPSEAIRGYPNLKIFLPAHLSLRDPDQKSQLISKTYVLLKHVF